MFVYIREARYIAAAAANTSTSTAHTLSAAAEVDATTMCLRMIYSVLQYMQFALVAIVVMMLFNCMPFHLPLIGFSVAVMRM
jgi:hypothetical protein